MYWFDQLLLNARVNHATDVHLRADMTPVYRSPTGLVPQKDPLLRDSHMEDLVQRLLGDEGYQRFQRQGEADVAFSSPRVGRARINCYRERGRLAVAVRLIPLTPPTLADLHLAEATSKLADYPDGLVIVAGPTGCGKSTTLAAVLNQIRQQRPDHIVTIEDPIEYVYDDSGSAVVSQREVGTDTESFSEALRSVMRQDPDIIVIGEARDSETMFTALSAAETGHLVFTTLHTVNVPETISRVLELFPHGQHAQVRHALGGVLRAVLCQRMLPRADGAGRVVAQEIMFKNGRVMEAIIDPEKTGQLDEIIAEGRNNYSMQTFNQALADLVVAGKITTQTALEASQSPQDLRVQLTTITGRDPLGETDQPALRIGLN